MFVESISPNAVFYGHPSKIAFILTWFCSTAFVIHSSLDYARVEILPFVYEYSQVDNSDSSFCVSLCLQLQYGRPRGPTSSLPPSKCTMSPIKFSTRNVRQTLLQLDTSKSKGPDGIPAIVLKTCAPELATILNKLFQLSCTLGTFPTSWKQAHVFPIPKKATSLIHSTIVPLQSLHSYLKQWRPSALNNFLPS